MNFENRLEVWSLSCVYHKQAGNKIRLSSKDGIDCRPRLSQEKKKKTWRTSCPVCLHGSSLSSTAHQVSVLVTAAYLAPSTVSGTINIY